MKVLKINPKEPEKEIIQKVVEIIKVGGLVVYPTETLYGLGADAFNDTAVQRIFEVKGREFSKNISVAFRNVDQAKKYLVFNEKAEKLAKKFLPGPLTIILQLKPEFQNAFLVSSTNIGMRIPKNKVAQKILNDIQIPITATSANLSGQKSPVEARDAIEQIGEQVDIILDSGKCDIGKPSTIVDLSSGEIEILREGYISKEKIKRFF